MIQATELPPDALLLAMALRLPSTDGQARELALGRHQAFAAWSVEARDENQVILAAGRTRSWLSVRSNNSVDTLIYFGSAVVAQSLPSGTHAMGFGFWALGGFHRVYARALLRAAQRRLLAR